MKNIKLKDERQNQFDEISNINQIQNIQGNS